VSGDFGRGKESSIGRTATSVMGTSFAIVSMLFDLPVR